MIVRLHARIARGGGGAYLAAPLTLYLGTADIYPRPSFDVSLPTMKQGESRLARGQACFAFAEQLARKSSWAFNWRKVEASGVGREEAAMFNSKEIEAALASGHE